MVDVHLLAAVPASVAMTVAVMVTVAMMVTMPAMMVLVDDDMPRVASAVPVAISARRRGKGERGRKQGAGGDDARSRGRESFRSVRVHDSLLVRLTVSGFRLRHRA
jgi:hypothetical protein